eukprot:scpid39424/ scgid5265/ Uncharacterized glycosyltransferase AGO61
MIRILLTTSQWMVATICVSGIMEGMRDKSQQQRVATESSTVLGFAALNIESSLRCGGNAERRDQSCVFENLCYWPRYDSFVFVHGEDSVQSGMPRDRFSEAFLDLSSVDKHNNMYFEFSDVSRHALAGLNVVFQAGQHVLFKRFHPDNIMHVLHDDILPLYHTLRRWGSCRHTVTNNQPPREHELGGTCGPRHSGDDTSQQVRSVQSDGEHNTHSSTDPSTSTSHGGKQHVSPSRGHTSQQHDKYSSGTCDRSPGMPGIEACDRSPGMADEACDRSPGMSDEACDWPSVVFVDTRDRGPWFEWLQMLSGKGLLISMPDINSRGADTLTCFEHATIGLDKTSTWYQYGFDSGPQGAIPDSNASAAHIRQFVKFAYASYGIQQPGRVPESFSSSIEHRDTWHTCILARKHTRLILNEQELVSWLTERYSLPTDVIYIEEKSPQELIAAMRCCHTLVGMHGSALILAMFLPPGAALLELFPFAIAADKFTPYKTMAGLLGDYLVYDAWVNTNERLTVTHADRGKELGGLSHLPASEQNQIKRSSLVLPKPCCDDPEWLYRIYQDTTIDIASLSAAVDDLDEAAEQLRRRLAKQGESHTGTLPMFLDRPGDVSCQTRGDGILGQWKKPWNVDYAMLRNAEHVASNSEENAIWYEVWIQGASRADYKAFMTQAVSIQVQLAELHNDSSYILWVRAMSGLEATPGPFASAVFCLTA